MAMQDRTPRLDDESVLCYNLPVALRELQQLSSDLDSIDAELGMPLLDHSEKSELIKRKESIYKTRSVILGDLDYVVRRSGEMNKCIPKEHFSQYLM